MGGGIGTGLARTTAPPSYRSGSHTEPAAASRYQGMGICRVCGDSVSAIKNGTLRKHRRYAQNPEGAGKVPPIRWEITPM